MNATTKKERDLVADLTDRINEVEGAVKKLTPKVLKNVEDRLLAMQNRLSLMHERLTVVTECSLRVRLDEALTDKQRNTLYAAITWCIDMPDAWWKAGDELSTRQWVRRCHEEYQDYRLKQVSSEETPDSNSEPLTIEALLARFKRAA